MADLTFYLSTAGAYPYVPHQDHVPKSLYVDLPNGYYEGLRGQRCLTETLELLASGEKLGFDGVLVAEQHGTPVGLAPSAIMSIAWLARRTSRVLLGAVGPIMNAYLTPFRVAEEMAYVDVISGGRTFFGLPMGTGMQYHSYGAMSPVHARRRFWEAHDFVVKAFMEDGPFTWEGEYFNVPHVDLWPRPIQRPHPPFWIPSAGSLETVDAVARLRYTYLAVFSPLESLKRSRALLAERANEYGYELDPSQFVIVVSTHVAESDRQARKEAEAHFLWRFQNTIRSQFRDSFPPGYMSEESLRKMPLGGGYRSRDPAMMTYDELAAEGWVIAGSPTTVSEKLAALAEEVGAGGCIISANPGAMPDWMVRKSLTLFAEEVMPQIRPAGPVWEREARAGFETVSEYGARKSEPGAIPEARIEGIGVLDVRTAHVDDLRVATRP